MIWAFFAILQHFIHQLIDGRAALIDLCHLKLQTPQFAQSAIIFQKKYDGKRGANGQQSQQYRGQRTVFHISNAAENLLILPWVCPFHFSLVL